jgi:type III pantothenate kinase
MIESLLAIDIGNTKVKSCIYKSNSEGGDFLSFNSIEEIDRYYQSQSFGLIAVASVVPSLLEYYTNKHKNDNNVFVVDKDKEFNIRFNNDYFRSIGIDRLCSLEGAFNFFKSEDNKNDLCLVIDFGTANTMSLINKSGLYLGGLISPGIETMFKSLNSNTAQLPLLEKPEYISFLGNSTLANIASGVYNSALGLVFYTLEQIERSYPNCTIEIYITGGNAAGLLNFFNFDYNYIPQLVLDGIKQVAIRNNQ